MRVVLAIAIALLSLPMLGSTAYAGEPGVCDTNQGTGKVDSFMQNTQPDGSGDWANGNMNESRADLVEGDMVPQRVVMTDLQPGENELAFTYDVWVKDKGEVKWAYDYVVLKSMEGATVTRWYVENEEGPTAKVYVTFDVPAGVSTATLYYDAHIASELDHGAGSGAGSIDGSPYHGGLVSLNCARSGANANQIMASAIDAGELTVVKEATPADGTDFRFSITPGGDASSFALDDDGDATLPDRLTYRVAPGTYTVEELAIPDGWTLTDVVCDKQPSGATATSRSVTLADDELVTCTFTNNKIARNDLAVTHTTDPSYRRDYDWTVDKSVVGPASTRIAEGSSADFDYTVTVTPSAPKDGSFEVAGRISVANPNPIPVSGVTVTASIAGAACTVLDGGTEVAGPVSIPVDGKDLTYTCAMGAGTRADTAGTSTVELSWPAADYYGTSGSATSTEAFDFAAANPAVTDDSVTVTDSHFDLTTQPGGNVVGVADGARTFSYPLSWPGEPGACTTYDNTATITETDGDRQSDTARAEVCEGMDLTVEKTVVHDYFRTYPWSLGKAVVGPARKDVDGDGTATFDYEVTATAGAPSDSAWGMSGTITVANPNAWAVSLTDVEDEVDIGGGASCVVSKGTDLVVAANDERRFDYTCTFTSRPSYDGTNTATVTWDATEHVSPHTEATGTAAVSAERWAETSVDKTVTVVDDKTDPANPVELGTATWAGEGTSKVFRYTGPALEGREGDCVDHTNTAWIAELPETRATAKVTVCWPADVTVSKDVDATFDTTYFWDVEKSVDEDHAEVGPGGTAPFTYTVVAKPNGSEDSNWTMSGTITVRNPNTYKPVTVTLSDVYDGGGVCTPASSTVEVPAATRSGGTVTPGTAAVAYDCQFSGRPGYTGTNTVTATWQGGRAEATAPVEFRQAGTTDYEVPVVDDFTEPGAEHVLGTVRWDDPVEKRTFTNTLDLGADPGRCVDHTNTARVDVTTSDVAVLPQLVVAGLDPFAQQTVTVCEEAPLALAKKVDASYDTTYFWDIEKSVDDTQAEVGEGGTAPFTYTVVAKPNGSEDSGWRMSGTITVTNPNTYKPATVTLGDEYDGGGVCTPGTRTVEVAEGGSVDVPVSCEFSERPSLTGTSTVTASWDGDQVRTSVPVTFRQAGRTDYEVDVFDDLTRQGEPGELLGTVAFDDPVEERTFTNTLELGAAPGECVDHTNTAWLVVEGMDPSAQRTVTVCETAPLGLSKTVEATYDTRYFWDVTKEVDHAEAEVGPGATAPFTYTVVAKPDGSEDSGWRMSGTITVTNPNTYEPVTVELSDVYDGGGVCTPEANSVEVPSATRSGGSITPGKVDVGYSCAFTSRPAYTGTNTVTASWDGRQVRATTPVTFRQAARTDFEVDVRDDLTQQGTAGELLGTVAWDDPVEERTFTNTLELGASEGRCADHTNTAWVEVEGDDPSADRTVTVCEKAMLVVSKDATATYDTTYFWDVEKSVDDTEAEVGPGGTAPFTYTVVARPDGSEDSGWRMSGTIAVRNPNTYKPVTVTLSDDYDGGGVCTPESTAVVVPEGESVDVAYSCVFTSRPAYTGTNTVTASWDGQEVTATTPVTFRQAGTTDYEVDVRDDLTQQGTAGELLGTVVWDDPVEERTFTNTLNLGAAPGQCVDRTNTAWLVVEGTDPSAQQTVTVCEKADLGLSNHVAATYDTRYLWDVTKQVDRTEAEVTPGGTAPFTYTVVARPNGSEDSGWRMSGTITVTNPNTFEPVAVTLSQVYDGGGVCTPEPATVEVPRASRTGATITPGAVEVPYSCEFSQQPEYTGTKTLTASWDGGLARVEEPVEFRQAGRSDFEVDVRDDLTRQGTAGELLGTVAWDDPVEERTFTNTLDLGADPGECAEPTNTAWVVVEGEDPSASTTVAVCSEAGLVISKDVDASFDRAYRWLVDKSVDDTDIEVTDGGDATVRYTVKATPDGFTDSAYAMGGTITVTNPNRYGAGAITAAVTDVPSVGDGVACAVDGGESVVLQPGQSKDLGYTCSFDGTPSHSGSNAATATWAGPDGERRSVSTGDVPVEFEATGHTDRLVTVTDSLTTPSVLGTAEWNADGTPTVFDYTLTHEGTENTCVGFPNTAAIQETGQSDSETVTVCDQGGLVVARTLEATYDRTYRWDITKVADRERVHTTPGRPGTVDYTVGVTPAGFEDSGWEMSGTVTVLNPNDYKDVTVELTDVPDVGGGASCVFDETEDLVVAAGRSRAFAYSCTFEEQPAYDGTDTVHVDWSDGRTSATTDVPFEVDQETDRTVTVTDDLVDPSELGTVTWDESLATVEFDYTLELDGPAGACDTVTNTATIVETGQSAQADVEVCGSAPPGKGRPPVGFLPETGAPDTGLWTTAGGLMLVIGALLLLRRRSQES